MRNGDENAIRLVGFDGDDTLWRSQDYFDAAQAEFESIVGAYADLADVRVHDHLYQVEKRNLALFGYGVKGMALSMIEAALEITGQRIAGHDVRRIVELAKSLLQHPVELLPGVREAVEAIAAEREVVLITKGDLFHQENEVWDSRQRAKRCKLLIHNGMTKIRRRKSARLCGLVGPDVAHSRLDFAPITEAA